MADFDFVVDTTPMAETVSSVSNHVTATTTAVVAMQAAVIASEKASANKICNNVDAGFHSLIRSQLSMKTSVAYTEMQAKLALLLEYSKTLRKTRDRMEADFNRVKRQYSQIFKGLDKALSNRISQLDKSAVAISNTREKTILGMFEHHVPEVVVTSGEVDYSKQKIAVSRIKEKTATSLNNLSGKVSENTAYRSLMDSMLEKTGTEKEKQEYIPVIYSSKQSSLVRDSYVLSLNFPDYLPEQAKNNISLNILNNGELFSSDDKNDYEKNAVSDEFQSLVSSSSLDPRVAQQMMALFQQGGC
ncbi:MAG: hypothetical protein ACI4JV_11040 [Ruminiclostridium sp.]